MDIAVGNTSRHAVANAAGYELSASLVTRYVVSPNAIDCPLGEGLAVLNATAGVYFSLNPAGALIWDLARQPATVSEMRERLSTAFPNSNADFEADIAKIVSELVDAGLFDALPDVPAEHDPA